jgi:hypothetical protein
MAEETTTETTKDEGAEKAQPVVEEQVEAVETPTVESEEKSEDVQEEQTEETAGADDESAQLAKFAKDKGLELDSENAIKAAKMAMNAEKRMHESTRKASELEKTAQIADEQVPVDATQEVRDNVRVRNLELKFEIQNWRMNNPDKVAQEANMVEVLKDEKKRLLVQEGYLSLDDIYRLAKTDDTNAVKSQTKQDTLKSLAQKQQAAVPTGNATTSDSPKRKFEDLSIPEMEAQLGFARR